VEAGERIEVLDTAAVGDEGDRDPRSSIAIARGCLFICTATKLYRVAK